MNKDPCFHDAIIIIKEYIEKYSNIDNIEIEFRLGYIKDKHFNPDIGKKYFEQVINKFIDSTVWDKYIVNKTEDYFINNNRLTINKNNSNIECIKKEKLTVLDFNLQGSGFDLRVSISKETPVDLIDINKSNFKRNKERSTFIYKHLSYDLTKVTYENNSLENNTYEIELELNKIDLNKMTSYYIVHDALLKIRDIILLCENIEGNPKFILCNSQHYIN